MIRLFEERLRGAEYGFSRGEAIRFLTERGGIEIFGRWAADRMRGDNPDAYVDKLLNAFVSGCDVGGLLAGVCADLAAAGVVIEAGAVGEVLASAISDTGDALHHAKIVHTMVPTKPDHHRHDFWGWEV